MKSSEYNVTVSDDQQFLLVAIPIRSLIEGLVLPKTKKQKEDNLSLTPREQHVFDGINQQRGNKEIAAHLNISERTVKYHASNLFVKLGVPGRRQLREHFSKVAA